MKLNRHDLMVYDRTLAKKWLLHFTPETRLKWIKKIPTLLLYLNEPEKHLPKDFDVEKFLLYYFCSLNGINKIEWEETDEKFQIEYISRLIKRNYSSIKNEYYWNVVPNAMNDAENRSVVLQSFFDHHVKGYLSPKLEFMFL